MARIIWFSAGMTMALNGLVNAVEGPRGLLAHVDPTTWAAVFLLGSAAWVWMAIDAARGRF